MEQIEKGKGMEINWVIGDLKGVMISLGIFIFFILIGLIMEKVWKKNKPKQRKGEGK